ncbi:hypothetical protein [Bradyrhizobium sp.]|uniref:hypothetical protein n=1 Tax=Bradyrhizobium sp. TaxID=376 RepID=UPI0039E2E327
MSAKGFKCRTCGKHHLFSAYVYAHADIELVHTCDNCGAKHWVLRYRAELIKAGKKPEAVTESR